MNHLLYSDWEGDPPRILSISHPMPGTPYMPLTGGGTTKIPLERFLKDIERDLKSQIGDYYAYVWGHYESDDEADIYVLQTWQVCPPNDGTYEAVIILYYAALNPYLTIKKYFGEDSAQEYLNRNAAITAIVDALA
ncbi:MAG TPA: hypothetical protein DCL61_08660 [Cyanobacteria bacterium UBA12227]|nr:hypothetical protein [Cyanobacteria bacterium UBA12227]HAX88186.1 hypothetical protein [Cyanobacteria bacterium UBA11370]HBY76180.1 hypothetical protein [Cyanobacteria bacterium UBA11148]